MSVLICSRFGCDNIMCDRDSSKYGRICLQCFDELVSLGPCTDIRAFMEKMKPEGPDKHASYAYFDAIFPDRSSHL